ncbi:MAG: hypothetical protein PF570_01640 [Candidatus Cloacimonetes bacterium]|jgi:hypothetical protein|nr:hypothetical protein [Candidatus Cloacimonadota bacterium]
MIIIVANRLRRVITKNREFKKIETNSREIQKVTQHLDNIIKLSKDYRKPKKSTSKITALEREININLNDYDGFLKNDILSLMKSVYYEENNYRKMLSLSIPNLFDLHEINPFFMFLVYKSIDKRTIYRIKEKQEAFLFWNEFKFSLELYKVIQIQNKINNQNIPDDLRFTDKVTPRVLFQVIEERDKGNSASEAIINTADDYDFNVSESYIREWLEEKSEYYSKFRNRSYSYIVKRIAKEDVLQWFMILGRMDYRFNDLLEEDNIE